MTNTIEIHGKPLTYELTYKRVKNLNLRIKADGSVCVSASRRVPLSAVEKFIISKYDFILRAQERCRLSSASPAPAEYSDGEKIFVLGREYTIRILADNKEGVLLRGGSFIITLPDIYSVERRRTLAEGFLFTLCKNVFSENINKARTAFENYSPPFSGLTIRKMTSRWGSCRPKSGKITLNFNLIHYSEELIYYVVVHEFCHFVYANHSADFYRLLESFIPDRKEKQKLLNEQAALS